MAKGPSIALAALLAACASLPGADLRMVVIVNADSGVTKISREEVRNLFLGRQKRLPSGLPAAPVEQQEPPSIRQAHPPREVSSAEEVVRAVTANRNAIGLVEWGRTDSRVRGVLDVDDPDAH